MMPATFSPSTPMYRANVDFQLIEMAANLLQNDVELRRAGMSSIIAIAGSTEQ
jgi:hypothetical protein